MSEIDFNKVAAVLIIFNIALVLAPAFMFNLPVVQTDGATHYVYAKTFMEAGTLDVENPPYNQIGSIENSLSEYPPFSIYVFSALLSLFGNDVFLINGGLGVIFFIIASTFVYLILKELTGDDRIATIGLVLSILNLRAYFTLFTGVYPAFIAFALTLPALYFALKFFKDSRIFTINLALVLVFTVLTVLTYTVQGLFLIFLEIMLWIGVKFDEKVKIKFHTRFILRKFGMKELKKLLLLLIPLIAIFLVVMSSVVITDGTSERITWIDDWFSSLMSSCASYPCVWTNFLITDGPIFMLLATLGFIYLILKNKWTELSLVGGGLLIVLSGSMFVDSTGILVFIYRFYTTFFVLMSIPVSIFVYRVAMNRKFRQVGVILIVLLFLIQFVKLGYFYSQITPAITQDEFDAAARLSEYNASSILFVSNENEINTFKSFKWVVVYTTAQDYTVQTGLYDFDGYDYIYVQNTESLSREELVSMDGKEVIFDQGLARIYKL